MEFLSHGAIDLLMFLWKHRTWLLKSRYMYMHINRQDCPTATHRSTCCNPPNYDYRLTPCKKLTVTVA